MQNPINVRHYLSSPYVLIGLVVAAGLAVNLYLAADWVRPSLAQAKQLDAEIAALQQQKETLAKRPIPVKVSDSEMASLLRQVPVREELARFLIEIRTMEQASGVGVDYYHHNTQSASPAASLAPLLAGVAQAAGSAASQAGTPPTIGAATAQSGAAGISGGSAPQAGTPPTVGAISAQTGVAAASGVSGDTITLTVSGTYLQVRDFMSRLYTLERLVSIGRWSLDMGAPQPFSQSGQSSAVSTVQDGGKRVTLTLDATVYTAWGYAGKLPAQSGAMPSTDPAERRIDPTWSDEQFRALLQTTTP